MKVVFVRLGIMGRLQALNIMKASHAMAVWARRKESMQPLADAGATTCASPSEAA